MKPSPATLLLCLATCFATTFSTLGLTRSELIPENAQADVRVSNLSGLLEKLQASSFGKLWNDPQFQDFLGRPGNDIWQDYLFGDKSPERDMMVEQFRMLDGEIVVALPENGSSYVIVAMSEDDFRESLLLDDKLSDSDAAPFDIVRDTFQGVDMIEHIYNSGTEEESHSWQAFRNNTLVMGPDREWVERSIVQLGKGDIEEPAGKPSLDVNLPLSLFIDGTIRGMNALPSASGDALALFEALGIMDVEHFNLHLELEDDKLVIDNTLFADNLGRGIFAILDTKPTTMPSVPFLPENMSMLEVGRVDLLRLWNELPNVAGEALPELKPQIATILAAIRAQLGVDPGSDLLGYMGTRYLGFSSLENDNLDTVIAMELNDSRSFVKGLETIINAPAIQPLATEALDTTDFLGYTLYCSKDATSPEAFAFSVAGNHVFYGTPAGVRQVVRVVAGERAANPRTEQSTLVRGIERHVPSSAFGFTAIDWNKNIAHFVRELDRNGTVNQLFGQLVVMGSPVAVPNLEKLPPAEHIASFFGTTYQYIEKTNRGLHQQIIMNY